MKLNKAATFTPPKVFYSVQALRGIGGIFVILAHLAIRELQDWPKAHFKLMYPTHFFGFGGVEVFFVISGFIITVSTLSKFGNKDAVIDYAFKRFYRIYPLYWVLGLITISGFLINREHTWRNWLNAFFLLPGFCNQINPVSWSLIHEIVFYVVFGAMMLISARWIPLFLSAWAILITFHQFNPTVILSNWFYTPIIFHLYNFAFIFGVAIALMAKKKMIFYPATSLAIGIAWLSFGAFLSSIDLVPHLQQQPFCLLFLEVSAAFITYGAIGMEYQGRWKMPAWLIYVGDASYSLYLVHYMVIMAVKPVYPMLADSSVFVMVSWTLFVGALAMTLGLLCYRYIEQPLLKVCMDKMPKFKPMLQTAVVSSVPLRVPENAPLAVASTRQD